MGADARVQNHERLCKNLETQVKSSRSTYSFYHPAVRNVLATLKEAYASFLLEHYEAAQANQIEFRLWSVVFHQVISEFRRKISAAAGSQSATAAVIAKGKAAFQEFLAAGKAFYEKLLKDLQEVYGNQSYARLLSKGLVVQSTASATADVVPSVYRCLICLGDLARYEADLQESPKKDFEKAREYYCLAVAVYPQGGNSYNQLAVLSHLCGTEIATMYYYVRSLAAEEPFSPAERNLNCLFEINLKKFESLCNSTEKDPKQRSGKKPLAIVIPEMSTRFGRLFGILSSKVNLDDFDMVLDGALQQLEGMLTRVQVICGPKGHGPMRSDALFLQLVALSIYFIPSLKAKGGERPEEAVILEQELRHHSLTVYFILAARLLEAVSSLGEMGGVACSPLMPAICIALQWMATSPLYVRLENPSPREIAARTAFFLSLSKFLTAAPPAAAPGMDVDHVALPEDRILQAFRPLLAAQSRLDFITASEDSEAVRMDRVYLYLKEISCHATSVPQQAFTVHGASKLVAAMNAFQAEVEASPILSPLRSCLSASSPVAVEDDPLASHIPPPSPLGDEDYVEEVIVYEPKGSTTARVPDSNAIVTPGEPSVVTSMACDLFAVEDPSSGDVPMPTATALLGPDVLPVPSAALESRPREDNWSSLQPLAQQLPSIHAEMDAAMYRSLPDSLMTSSGPPARESGNRGITPLETADPSLTAPLAPAVNLMWHTEPMRTSHFWGQTEVGKFACDSNQVGLLHEPHSHEQSLETVIKTTSPTQQWDAMLAGPRPSEAMWASSSTDPRLQESHTLGQVLGLTAFPSPVPSGLGGAGFVPSSALQGGQFSEPTTSAFNLPVDPFDQGLFEPGPRAAGMDIATGVFPGQQGDYAGLLGLTAPRLANGPEAQFLQDMTLLQAQNASVVQGTAPLEPLMPYTNMDPQAWHAAQTSMDQLGLSVFGQPEAQMYGQGYDVIGPSGTPSYNWLDELQAAQDQMVAPGAQSSAMPGVKPALPGNMLSYPVPNAAGFGN
eukprot:jgi/Botrbrau1/2242/Bobra.101_2s0070.1